MKPTRIHGWVASALVIAGLLLWLQSQDEEQADASPAPRATTAKQSHSAEMRGQLALRREVAELRGELSELRESARRRAREGALDQPAQQVSDAQQDGKAIDDPYGGMEPAERDAAIADDLRAAMNAEPADESWRDQTEATFHSAIARIDGADAVEVECRSTLCRVELAHATPGERTQGTDAFTTRIPWDASGYVHMVSSDPPTSVIYIARDGHDLPRPSQATR